MMTHDVNIPANPMPCPKCGGTDYSVRVVTHRVVCNNCGMDITDEVSTWSVKSKKEGELT
jgi:transcription initiation factor TFIIIB Brf1 subunit/transcription initiation factor TFIIB